MTGGVCRPGPIMGVSPGGGLKTGVPGPARRAGGYSRPTRPFTDAMSFSES